MTEVEKMEKDQDTGKRVKLKCLEYEYEAEMEDTYRNSMLKTFRKTLDDGFFPFIIIDAINDRVKYFDQFWSAAKTKGFEVSSCFHILKYKKRCKPYLSICKLAYRLEYMPKPPEWRCGLRHRSAEAPL
uniref:Uncharacterized protein n=1 Tax=Hucho hucho TaxID=62062 RepID=A0A4W5LAK7_9TELE